MVIVVPDAFFCITTWLPRRRVSTKPCLARIAHTSRPERTAVLTNRDLHLRDVHLFFQPLPDFLAGSGLKKEFEGLAKVVARFFDRGSLAGDVQFRTQGHVPVIFPLYNGSKLSLHIGTFMESPRL